MHVSSDVIHTIHNDDDIISIELLKRRNIGRTGLRSEYFIRRIVMPSSDYDEEIPRSKSMNDEIPLTLKRICYKIVSQIYAEEFIDDQYRDNSYKPVHFIPVV